MTLLVATQSEVLVVDADAGTMVSGSGLEDQRPTCLSADPHVSGRAWCGTHRGGVYVSDDRGATWRPAGLADHRLTSITASPVARDLVWAGTEPSRVWRSDDAGRNWNEPGDLDRLPSSSEWAFPPKPETHHVRWIAGHPRDADRLWVAIEAGALISTVDGGRSWRDRVAGGPYDTHELAIHPERPETLRVSAGDGYYESEDGGATWERPREGLEVGYLRSVAIDPGSPDVVVVSAASSPRRAYGAGVSDGRIYRRAVGGRWERVREGWPDPPATIAPMLLAGASGGELWAADERGVHRSEDGGESWAQVAAYPAPPTYLRGVAYLPTED